MCHMLCSITCKWRHSCLIFCSILRWTATSFFILKIVCAFDVAYVTWFEPNLFQHIIPVPLKNFPPDLFSMLHALFYRTLTFYLHSRLGFGFPAFCYIEWRFYGVWCVNQKHWTTAYDNKASEIAPWLVLKFEVRPKLAFEGGKWPEKNNRRVVWNCVNIFSHIFDKCWS